MEMENKLMRPQKIESNKNMPSNSSVTKRLSLLNRYYKITKFYSFLKATALKGGTVIVIFVLLLVGLELFVLDFDSILNGLVDTYPPAIVFSFFLASSFQNIISIRYFLRWSHPFLSKCIMDAF